MDIHQMTRDLVRLARSQYGVVTLAQLVALGFSRQMVSHRVRTGELIRMAPGVYALASFAPSWQRQYKAAELSIPGASLAGFAAAQVHGAAGFRVVRPELVVPSRSTHRTRLATVHRSDTARTMVVDRLRVTTPAQTFVDLVARTTVDRWERGCDSLLLDGRMTVEELEERRQAYESSRRPGIALLRALVDERLDEAWVPPESALEHELRQVVALVPQCPGVVWQADLPWGEPGEGRVDGFVPAWGLVLEADGRRWHARVHDFDVDRWRDNQAAAAGLRVQRFTWTHLTQRPDEVVQLIEAAGAASAPGRAAA